MTEVTLFHRFHVFVSHPHNVSASWCFDERFNYVLDVFNYFPDVFASIVRL